MLDVNYRLEWHGDEIDRQLKVRLKRNLKAAIKLYYDELKRVISIWGSFPGSAFFSTRQIGIRTRKVHSKPGEPPRRQTSNLYNSIEQNVDIDGLELIAEVSSDVPYAGTLEFGGTLQIPQNEKTHTSTLINNPIITPISISPRPAWVPTFERLKDKMLEILARD